MGGGKIMAYITAVKLVVPCDGDSGDLPQCFPNLSNFPSAVTANAHGSDARVLGVGSVAQRPPNA